MNFPETKKENIETIIFDNVIRDPYRWLENGKSKETKEWTDAQNIFADTILRNEAFDVFSSELIENHNVVDFSNPVFHKGKYFYSERKPQEEQFSIYVKKGIDGTPVKLVDGNGTNPKDAVSIDYWSISRTGKYLIYGLSVGGNEMPVMYVFDVDAKIILTQIERCKDAQAKWLPDDSGFFYKKNPCEGTVPKNEEHLHSKVYFHKLGDNPKDDELIFGKGRPMDDMLGLTISVDGIYLAINASQKWTENDIYIYTIKTKKTIPFVVGLPAKFSVYFSNDKIFLLTNHQANNYRVLSSSIESLFVPITEWNEIIPEREYVLESLFVTKDSILAEYLVNACSKVEIFDHEGKRKSEIPLPQYSTLAGISANREESEFFYGVTSFILTKIIYRYIPDENNFTEYRKIDNPVNPNDYVVKQEWYSSKDGAKIPLFILHKKNTKKDALMPTILYGYGGFGCSQNPMFNRNFVPWIKRGGAFAVANIRGGGEFGDKWHKQGMKENKQNSFNDFISASEYLIKEGYTDNNHLGILGGSNGGLLVNAVEVQRPELFKAVCSRVPLTDMVRFPIFGMASRWVNEYGNPDNKEDLKNILKWSPYHNVNEGVEYPATFFTTANNDSRVDPLHSRKMTALLQSVNKKNTIMLFTEMNAGHGPGRPMSKIIESGAMILSFFAKELGLK